MHTTLHGLVKDKRRMKRGNSMGLFKKTVVKMYKENYLKAKQIAKKCRFYRGDTTDLDLAALLYFVCDLAKTNSSSDLLKILDVYLNGDRDTDEAFDLYFERVHFYEAVASEKHLYGYCAPGKKLDNPIQCCVCAFADCMISEEAYKNYDSAPFVLLDVMEAMHMYQSLVQPLTLLIARLYTQIYESENRAKK